MILGEKITEYDLAYLAGFFDGDGCVMISRQKSPTYMRGYKLFLQVELSQNPPNNVLGLAQKIFGGTICCPNKHRINERWATTYCQAADFLVAVYPYLRIKREEARLGLQFQQTMKSTGRVGYSDIAWNEKLKIRDKMREIKRIRRI